MRTDTYTSDSAALQQPMEVRRYTADSLLLSGRSSVAPMPQPLLAFPSLSGRVWDFEGYGMVEAIRSFIEEGRVTLYAADGVDWQSWAAADKTPEERAARHRQYNDYLVDELLPMIREQTRRDTLWATGCSGGAFHSTSLWVRHPELVDGVIALSGVYQLRRFVGDYDAHTILPEVLAASPLDRLPREVDEARMARYRRSKLAFCVGQGAWEDDMLADTRAMEALFIEKAIPGFFDYWGHDVNHDWPWWQKMLPYLLGRLLGD
jgi:esterase/lipase superfamily enzyme